MRARRLTTALVAAAAAVAGASLVPSPASAAQSTVMQVYWPTQTPYVGNGPVVQGGVSSRVTRPVQLQQLVGSSWRTVASSTVGTKGVFDVTIPTSRAGAQRLRVVLPATGDLGGSVSAVHAVSVKPSNPQAFAFVATSPIARWNPCDGPIGWRINASQASAGALVDTKAALTKISAATGLRFAYRGTTTIIPGAPKAKPYPRDTQLVVAWVKPGQSTHFTVAMARSAAGIGGPQWQEGFVDGRKQRVAKILSGEALLDATKVFTPGFGLGPVYGSQGTRGQLLMHELGHAVGLQHPAGPDTSQIMFPRMGRKLGVYGAGDLRGLKALGSGNGCVTARRSSTPTPVTGLTLAS